MSDHAGPATTQAMLALIPILTAAGLDGAVKVVGDACEDVAALSAYIRVQETNMREIRNGELRAEQEVNRLRALIPLATRAAEQSVKDANDAVFAACHHFNTEREKLDALRAESNRDFVIPIQRRDAAKGA